MKTNVFTVLQQKWMQMSQDQFCNTLNLVKGSEQANNLYRNFTFIGSNIAGPGRDNLMTPEMLAHIVGYTNIYPNTPPVVKDKPENLYDAQIALANLMAYVATQKASGRSEYNRHMAVIFTHLEEAMFRLTEVARSK